MKAIFGSVVAVGFLMAMASEAFAAPLMSHMQPSPSSIVEVKVICFEDGNCIRPPKRKPVARWVYGDGNFYGPYAGPGNYGNPRTRYGWGLFYWY